MKRAPVKPIQLTTEQIQVIETAVLAAVEPQLPAPFYLLDVTLEKESGYWYLRLYVEEKSRGIALSDCETISRLLDPIIDGLPQLQDLIFNLEVSSPGLFRPLRRPREFAFFLGQPVRVEDRPPTTKSKKVAPLPVNKPQEGELQAYNPEKPSVTLKNPQTKETFEVTLDATKMVCLNPVIRFPDQELELEPANLTEATQSHTIE